MMQQRGLYDGEGARCALPMVRLVSSDHKSFVVSQDVARLSVTVQNLLDDTADVEAAQPTVPLPNVDSGALARVVEYAAHHAGEGAGAGADEDAMRAWDDAFVRGLSRPELFDLVLAANYLNMDGLLDLTCGAIAELIKGKSPEEIRELLGVANDFTPEEEEQVRRENQWAFD